MADPEDRALGAAIRRRRTAAGLQQREVADALGVATVVYGRIELGSRPVRATELRDIARELGVSADDLLSEVTPAPIEEAVEKAAVLRDAALGALKDYGIGVLAACNAVEYSRDGALPEGASTPLTDREDVLTYLLAPVPSYTGPAVTPSREPLIRRAWMDLIEAMPVRTDERTSRG